jgi:hypothetical protein
MTLQAATIVELVSTVAQVRAITQAHPELKSVAQELLTMRGPLPSLNGRAMVPVVTRNPVGRRQKSKRRTLSAAQREQRSKSMKARWRKAKKAGKNTIGGAE